MTFEMNENLEKVSYKKHGVIHSLVKRSDLCLCKGNFKPISVELYECRYEGSDAIIGWNVEVIKEGVNYWTKLPCRVRPSDEQYGTYGWSCSSLDRSLKKFDEVFGKLEGKV
jgi:hypothetical protein